MFEYFPENYVWNLAINLTLNAGGNIGEVDDACREIRRGLDGPDPGRAFFDGWMSIGDRLVRLAAEDEAKGRRFSAGAKYARATIYYMTGERATTPSFTPRAEAYRKMLDCFTKYVALTEQRCTRVEIPYRDGSLPALFVAAGGGGTGSAPCMVHFDGLDVMKEFIHLTGMPRELSRRGVSTLIVDHPGVGEALRRQGLTSFPEAEVPASAAVDYLVSRPDVDQQRIGIMGLSLGGYYAPRAAAFEKRFACCVAWGANFNWGEVQRMRFVNQAAGTPVPHYWEHVQWVMGQSNVEEFLDFASGYRLVDVAQRITCPILITHGENDRQIALAYAHAQYEACVNSSRRELKIHTLADGGAEHCSVDNLPLAVDYIADWIAETFETHPHAG